MRRRHLEALDALGITTSNGVVTLSADLLAELMDISMSMAIRSWSVGVNPPWIELGDPIPSAPHGPRGGRWVRQEPEPGGIPATREETKMSDPMTDAPEPDAAEDEVDETASEGEQEDDGAGDEE